MFAFYDGERWEGYGNAGEQGNADSGGREGKQGRKESVAIFNIKGQRFKHSPGFYTVYFAEVVANTGEMHRVDLVMKKAVMSVEPEGVKDWVIW